jgi:KWG Leptospira./Bacterial RNA polymerase, alpha chain C terminal domain.
MANNRKRHKPYSNPSHLTVKVEGDEAVLGLSIEELGLKPDTLALLQNNKFATVMDIARRTEREMFKIQTFNKKHLIEIKGKINAKGVDFLPPIVFEPKPDAQNAKLAESVAEREKSRQNMQGVRQQNSAASRDRRPDRGERNDRNGRGERQDNRLRGDARQPQKPLREKSERPPKVLLPLEEWRKVSKNGKWGFSNGLQTVIQPQFDEVFSFKDGLACVEVDEKFGYINQEGEFVIEPMYECAMSFSEGLAVIFENEKCGYINKQNVKVIDCKFDAATAFESGRAKVKEDGKWGTIAPDGTTLWSK